MIIKNMIGNKEFDFRRFIHKMILWINISVTIDTGWIIKVRIMRITINIINRVKHINHRVLVIF